MSKYLRSQTLSLFSSHPFLQANRPWFPARNAPSSSKRAYQRLGGFFLLKMGKFSARALTVDYEGLQKPGVAEYSIDILYKRQYIDQYADPPPGTPP